MATGRLSFVGYGETPLYLSDIDDLVRALNDVYLPEQFSAIWHRDTKDFEVIWTSQPLPSNVADIAERNFTFRFKNTEYKCEFGRSSDRLLILARNFITTGASSTQFRNLPSFQVSLNIPEELEPLSFIGEPRSFWIRNVYINIDDMLDIVNHLNFYMTYYDTRSPTILVHSSQSENEATRPQARYISSKFPSSITVREIDDNLLHFGWQRVLEILQDDSFTIIESLNTHRIIICRIIQKWLCVEFYLLQTRWMN